MPLGIDLKQDICVFQLDYNYANLVNWFMPVQLAKFLQIASALNSPYCDYNARDGVSRSVWVCWLTTPCGLVQTFPVNVDIKKHSQEALRNGIRHGRTTVHKMITIITTNNEFQTNNSKYTLYTERYISTQKIDSICFKCVMRMTEYHI